MFVSERLAPLSVAGYHRRRLCHLATELDPAGRAVNHRKEQALGRTTTSRRSFERQCRHRKLFHLPIFADAGSCPGNCPGMEESTGAPSSFAVSLPSRLRASRRDGGRITQPPVTPHDASFPTYETERQAMLMLRGKLRGLVGRPHGDSGDRANHCSGSVIDCARRAARGRCCSSIMFGCSPFRLRPAAPSSLPVRESASSQTVIA